MPRRTIMLLVAALVAGMLSTTGAQAAVTVENGVNASRDGILIAYSFAHPDGVTPSPVVAMTHGWGGSRTTDFSTGFAKTLLDNGYAVLTWDSRGFGTSGGEANVDSQEFEVKDLQSLITMIGSRSDVLLDGEEDPRMGMIGGSYAGGIQLMTASADTRIDAIVPQIAWNDLPQALKPGGVLKLGWDTALYGLGVATGTALGLPSRETGSVSPQIHQSLAEGLALNDWSTGTYDWFDAKSPKYYLDGGRFGNVTYPGISAPTLVVQGVSDTLFNLNHGIANYNTIRARGVPAKLLAFCGGHTITPLGSSCQTTGASAKIDATSLAWLNRYVKGDGSVDTGANIEYQVQDGTFHSIDALPTTGPTVTVSTSSATNTVAPTTGQGFAGTSGGCRPIREDEVGGTGGNLPARSYLEDCPWAFGDWIEIARYGGPTDSPACLVPGETVPPAPGVGGGTPPPPRCPDENFHLPLGTRLLGSPTVRFSVTGRGAEAYLFFKLIDYDPVAKVKTVIDDQTAATKITWPAVNAAREVTVEMPGVAWDVKPGHHVFLEITPTSNDHASSRSPFVLALSGIRIDVPTIEPAPPVAPTITAPAEGDLLTAPAAAKTRIVVVSGTAAPGAVIRVYRRGIRLNSGTVTADATGAWSTPASGSKAIKVPACSSSTCPATDLDPVTHSITATQQDAVGSVSPPSAEVTFQVQRV